MATRIEKRSLQARVNALRSNVYRLALFTDFGRASLIGRDRISRFNMYLRQTKALARVARQLNPDDRAWKHYDESMEKVDDYLSRDHGVRYEIRGHAVTNLHAALDMVLGSASRTSAVNSLATRGISRLAEKIKYGGPQERSQARSVLADLLEESGFEGEANTLRSTDKWSTIKKILSEMGVPVPNYEPYRNIERDARKRVLARKRSRRMVR